MKKSFNVLCATMFAVIVLYVAGSMTYATTLVYKTVTTAINMTTKDTAAIKTSMEIFDPDKYTLCAVTMVPYNFFDIPDNSIENTLTGEQTPIMPVKVMAFIKGEKENEATIAATGIIGTVGTAAYIFFLCYLIRFIRNVRRKEIFEWKNVKMLNRMGLSVIVAFITTLIVNLIHYAMAASLFAPKGYSIEWFDIISENILLLGIGIAAMMMGEVFACGLKMREEQELTI